MITPDASATDESYILVSPMVQIGERLDVASSNPTSSSSILTDSASSPLSVRPPPQVDTKASEVIALKGPTPLRLLSGPDSAHLHTQFGHLGAVSCVCFLDDYTVATADIEYGTLVSLLESHSLLVFVWHLLIIFILLDLIMLYH